jgi:hypothetical protein
MPNETLESHHLLLRHSKISVHEMPGKRQVQIDLLQGNYFGSAWLDKDDVEELIAMLGAVQLKDAEDVERNGNIPAGNILQIPLRQVAGGTP